MPALETMESLLIALWRASWQASLLILLVLLAQVTLRRWLSPAWRSALWLLVALRLLRPVTPPSNWSLFNLTRHLDTHRATAFAPAAVIEPGTHRSAGLRHGDVALADRISHVESPVSVTTEIPPHDASPQTASNDPMPGTASILDAPASKVWDSRGSWLPILFWIWLAGVLVLGARLVCGACLLSRRIRRHAVVSDRRTSELLEESRRVIGTRRAPVLMETNAVDSPALFGLLRPKLLLPTGLIRRLNQSELRHVFLHELAHLRRHDVLLNWLAALLQILHWFNPVVWFGFARMRADRELACDALALTRSDGIDRAAYGTTILKLVSDLTPTRQVAGLVGISEGKAHLKRRLRNIASHRTPTRWTTVMGALALLFLTGMTLTDARTNRVNRESSAGAIEAVPAQFEALERGVSVPLPEPSVATEAVKRSPGRQRIEAKLQRIVLDEAQFDGLSLPDVLSYLGEVVRQVDPDQVGINFLINPQLPTAPETPVVDPATGQVISVPQWEPMDMNRVKIQISPALRKVRLGELLEAITRGADKPITYSIEEYAIVFTPRPPELGVQLETRIYKVDPARLLAGIRATRPPGSEDRNPQEQVRDYFRDAGISVLPPNQIYFKDRKGVLMVRATTQELDNLQKAIDSLGASQRRIELEVRAVELTQTESTELGSDWFLGRTDAKPKSAGVFPGGPAATATPSANTPTTADDSKAPASTSFQLNGILTEPQFSVVLDALEQRPDTEIISLPRVTTSSGQLARISWITATGSTVELHCLPVAASDGYSLDLQLTVDYGADPSDELDTVGKKATPASARQSSTRRAVVWTGQTIVMGGLISESAPQDTDETLRRLRNLIVFITPTILDRGGNRVPLPRPFDPDTIPLQ